jgi:acyl carrier protein
LKQMVAEHSEGALSPSNIDMNESLVMLGLGSMQVVQFSGQLGADFQVELDEEQMFQEETTLNTIKNMILKSQGKEEIVLGVGIAKPTTTATTTTEDGKMTGKVAPMDVETGAAATKANNKKKGKGGTKRKTGPSTCQVVFCFCFRGSANQQDAKKNAALNRQAEDDF